MEELTLDKIFSFIANKAVLMTLLPSLFLNVLIDITKNLDIFVTTNKTGKIIVLNGLISLLGLGFGLIYYFILELPAVECTLHSLAIVGISYLLHKINFYELTKRYITNKIEGRKHYHE